MVNDNCYSNLGYCDNKYDICGESLECQKKFCDCPDGYFYSENLKCEEVFEEEEEEEDNSYSKFIKFNILFFFTFLFL